MVKHVCSQKSFLRLYYTSLLNPEIKTRGEVLATGEFHNSVGEKLERNVLYYVSRNFHHVIFPTLQNKLSHLASPSFVSVLSE